MNDIDHKQAALESILHQAPVVPVVVIDRLEHAVPMARALVSGGLPVIEITLRTPVALDAIRAIADAVDGAIPGVGTVLSPADFDAAQRAGARFAVSPGSTPELLRAAAESTLPWLPGAATASEAMALAEHGYTVQKCFPAQAVGGVTLLRSLAAPLPSIRFCPTGGITAATAPDYLAVPNVICVGGSWLTPAKLLESGDWRGIEDLARAASVLRT